MVAFPIWRLFFLLLSISAFYFIFYEDSQYKPFGFRYWLGVGACIWLNFVTLASYFIAFTGGSIMVYNQYKQPLVVIFLFCLFVASMLSILSFKAIKMMIRRTKYYRQARKVG
ncbi:MULTISPECIES: MFS transporter [Streptococcus]|nr:MFS transporter [Streptococcus suis]HEM4694862.1 MFS transporter [Streptococcus suis]HEM4858277.1 MFS transporter [Streptococcus suis]HEM4896550.1 MFS transporter [Streptococcus suis]HEM6021112.1 MFS transporter [Streptococcus suis]HEM6582573.1 MFS transporter [Streptococcus suis]